MALDSKDLNRAKEISFKQVQLYLGLAAEREKSSPASATVFYSAALTHAEESGDRALQGVVHFQRGMNYRKINDEPSAIKDFESALETATQRDSASLRFRADLVSQLTTLYLNAGQTEKARRLTQGSTTSSTRLEYTIKLASSAEQQGETAKADQLLASIQPDMLQSQDDQRIVEFAKKRYQLCEMQGIAVSGIDTLGAIVSSALRIGRSPGAILQLQQMLALLNVQSGKVQNAASVVEQMKLTVRKFGASPSSEATLDQTQADIAYLQGDNLTATTYYKKVLQRRETLSTATLLSALNNLGLSLMKNGQDDEAYSTFQQMYADATQAHDAGYQIQADLNAGIILVRQDRNNEAIERLRRARSAAESTGNTSLQVMASLRLAEAYRRAGYDKLAAGFFASVRAEQTRLSNVFDRIQVLQTLASSSTGSATSTEGLEDLRQAYDLALRTGVRGYLGTLASSLADAYFEADSLSEALSFYKSALQYYGTTTDIRTRSELGYRLGQCYLASGKTQEARDAIGNALKGLLREPAQDLAKVRTQDITEVDLYGEGLASLALADFTRGKQNSDIRLLLAALAEVQRSVALLEEHSLSQLSHAQTGTESVRNVNAYRLLVDIALDLYSRTGDSRYYELGFNTSEKSRAENFVSEVGTQLIGKINDPKLKKVADITAAIDTKKNTRSNLSLDLTESAAGTRGMKPLFVGTSPVPDKMESEYEDIVKKLRTEDKKSAQLISVNTLTLNSVKTFLEPDEVMLSYYFSIDECYLFLVGPGEMKLRVIHWMPDAMAASIEGFRKTIQDQRRTNFYTYGQALYDSLIAPVESSIAGKRLLIIPSGRLNTLPFAALPNQHKYLLESHEIAVIPNASTLQFIRTGKHMSASPSVLALGNPDNPRVSRLPGTVTEVNNIKNIYANSAVYLGDDASESRAKEDMGQYEIVHIACHGLFNYEFPLLSSLVLTPDKENDGFLQVHELYNLNLSNTNLVILSACETGLAEIKKNDDLIGLVRGFLYAGVPSTVASLWKVDDYATSLLMSNFHLLLKLGNTKSQALRKAQLQLLKNSETSHPFFWAAFVLYGNAK
jgi:CHAT domain-containing protein/tetratricopeptide (TPR) repeat protein